MYWGGIEEESDWPRGTVHAGASNGGSRAPAPTAGMQRFLPREEFAPCATRRPTLALRLGGRRRHLRAEVAGHGRVAEVEGVFEGAGHAEQGITELSGDSPR